MWRFNNNRTEISPDEDGNFVDFSEKVSVALAVTDILSGERWVEISIDSEDGGMEPIELPRDAIGSGIVPTLVKYGLTVLDTKDCNTILSEVLFDTEKTAEKKYVHDILGFYSYKNQDIYFAHHPIGNINPKHVKSKYKFSQKTEPNGTLEGWKAYVNKVILGSPTMELALALGALSPVAHVLRDNGVIEEVVLINIYGKSSTGKSTTMKVMADMFACPRESVGIIGDFDSTLNAFYAQLESKKGFPILFDETTAKTGDWDFSEIIYNLPKGTGKLRCNNIGKLREQVSFSGAIIFTGEHSLLNKVKSGMNARLFELNLPWTNNGEHARAILKGCRAHSGHAVYPLVEWILCHKDWIVKQYQIQFDSLMRKEKTSSGIAERLLKICAQIVVSAIVVKLSLNLDIDIGSIRNVLIEQYHIAADKLKSNPELWLENVKNKILYNNGKFPIPEIASSTSQVWGERGKYLKKQVFWVSEVVFENLVKEETDEDLNVVRKIFHENGWLIKASNNGFIHKRTIAGAQLRCYALNLSSEDVSGEEKIVQKSKMLSPKAGSKLKSLLDDTDEE